MDCRIPEDLVVWNGPQEGSGRVQGHVQTLGEGVACDGPHEDGRLLYRCQGLTRDRQDQGHRHVDLVPVVFPSEDGFGYTRDVCAECWTNRWRQTSWKHEKGAGVAAPKRRA